MDGPWKYNTERSQKQKQHLLYDSITMNYPRLNLRDGLGVGGWEKGELGASD